MNPLIKKYHSFEEWLNMDSATREQWYKLQCYKPSKSFIKRADNEAAEIERIERTTAETTSNRQLLSEINF